VSPAHGALGLVRASVLGACCLLLALTGHVLGGGQAPSPLALLVLAVPVGCLSVLMTGGRAGPYRIGLTLGLTQVGLHEAFMLLAQPHCTLDAATSAGLAGHGHAAMHATARCAPAMPMASATPAMVAAHTAAAVATGLLLWHGERLLWSVVAWVTVRLPAALRPPPATGTRPVAHAAVRSTARPLLLAGGGGRRGPPAVWAT
jgi:hypothetical protein